MLLLCVYVLFSAFIFSQNSGKISGIVTDRNSGLVLQGANIIVAGQPYGVSSDKEGSFTINLPAGKHTLIISYIGYEKLTKTFEVIAGETVHFNAAVTPSAGELDKIVVTGTRTEKNLRELPSKVTVLDNAVFEGSSGLHLGEVLGFQNGVRLEIDCQTCNFSQVRINGLGGGYTQILINSRPVFSSLNGLYGLEQIPVTMLERIEIVKGGGSALFGASAIGGTINIITKDPLFTHYSMTAVGQLPGGTSSDAQGDFNYSLISDTRSSGISFFGVSRHRSAYDANNDGFSELPLIKNVSFGVSSFYKPAESSKLAVDFHRIYEYRRGGNNIYQPPHFALQAEERTHKIYGGSITYDTPLPFPLARLAVYISGQTTDRDHYTGTFGADAYGTTKNTLWVSGIQSHFSFASLAGTGPATVTLGMEYSAETANDEIPGYNYYYNSNVTQTGFYLQNDWKADILTTILAGIRMDIHSLEKQPVFSPRINILRDLSPVLQMRLSYATGFRAAQAFDADLHIAMAGGGISRVLLDSSLTKETSVTYTASLDANIPGKIFDFGYTVEAFYTTLKNAFITVDAGADPQSPQNTFLLKKNGSGAVVRGVSIEGRTEYRDELELQAGLTLQQAYHSEPVEWSADAAAESKFLRTPNIYGFLFMSWEPRYDIKLSVTGVITGPMNIPHLAGTGNLESDKLEKSKPFFDINLRAAYTIYSGPFADAVEIFAGIKNMFNHYQKDFDRGPLRDSNYIYGPAAPRTVYAGFKINPL